MFTFAVSLWMLALSVFIFFIFKRLRHLTTGSVIKIKHHRSSPPLNDEELVAVACALHLDSNAQAAQMIKSQSPWELAGKLHAITLRHKFYMQKH
ncbi:MAG: hypothetical protein A2504_15120 [Bdellovibrionales bacterium RIFOXYD12_FULL_39_22]|nr:MAG: hypothetical protein A2385_02550 [Bdellovibrionales bacterium RIFOXYB1_FULL_39_21]OFZ43127.1 MAG: hypothetical protein A2485_11695 [Bdellovibrionales bacterium RIFOXYC12_FULL_39_17]OFZ47865.1 MAG: hypothetical protein A2404_16335 [Bdellovibrionales bacterium RIFOXYC1_FULL_39_130]OFZ75645.1 MAG: hypothetical protein A2560_12835 [Bdellovibrionales bacterium RIFOXYD1_FULL_39_84]OFZ76104.1 MAG: hypothetical protein A2451_13675 [Bdellovibrionales bacterium RIFOXYC2_FULL_39_8]OFZ94135.1 MAG: